MFQKPKIWLQHNRYRIFYVNFQQLNHDLLLMFFTFPPFKVLKMFTVAKYVYVKCLIQQLVQSYFLNNTKIH